MEKRLESLPTSRPSLLLVAEDIYRDIQLSKEEHEEKMKFLTMLSLEELKSYVVTRIYLHQQRFSHSSIAPSTAVAAPAAPATLGDGMSVATLKTSTPTPTPVGAPAPTSHHTPASMASRLFFFQEGYH